MSTVEIIKPYKVIYETDSCIITLVQIYYVLVDNLKTSLDLDKHNYIFYITKCGTPTKRNLEKEYSALLKLNHKNIVKVVGYNNITNTLTTEYIPGHNLVNFVNNNCINENNFKYFAKQMIDAVKYVHDTGYIHRDIKPDNFIVKTSTNAGHTIKLIDFEFAIKIGVESDISGTKEYIAPEIVLECLSNSISTFSFSQKSDIWSLGVTLFCVRYGTSPFIGTTTQQTYNLILNRTIKYDNTDHDFSNLLKGMLTKDIESRYNMNDIINSPFYLEKQKKD